MTPSDARRMWEGTTHCISSCHKQEGLLTVFMIKITNKQKVFTTFLFIITNVY